MCLSTVYSVQGDQRKQILKNIADIRMKDGKLIFTDIMGVPVSLQASIERIDLMDNYVLIHEEAPEGAI